MSESANLAGRLTLGIVAAATRVPLLTVLIVFGLSAASIAWIAAGNLSIDTDTADMISDELPWRVDFNEYRESFPVRDRNIVVVIDGPNGEASAEYANDLVAALAAESELFPTVFLPGHGEFFERNGLLLLPLERLEVLADRLIEAQPLLGRLSADVSGAGVLGVLDEALAQDDAIGPAAAADLDRILAEIEATLAASRAGERRAIRWGGVLGIEPLSESRQLVLIQPRVDYTRVRPAREAIERLRALAAELAEVHGEAVTMRLTGTLAMEHEEMSSITQSASAAGIAALVVVVVVLLWALRSPVLLLISVATLLAGLSLTAGFAALAVGRLNLLSVAFAVLYVGLGVDFILHLILRLKELRARGLGIDAALRETAGGVGGSLAICAVTTAVGFFAFIPTDFVGISELGLISGGGMFISLLVSLTLLPALLRLGWRGRATAAGTGRDSRIWRRISSLPPRATVVCAAILLLLTAWLLPGLGFDGNPINLRDPDAESVQALEDLAADSEAPLFNLAVLVGDRAEADALAASLAALPTVAQSRTVDVIVPAAQDDKLFILEDIDLVLGSTLADFRETPSDPARLVRSLEALAARVRGLEAPSAAQSDFLVQAEAWLATLRGRDEAAARVLATALDVSIRGNLVRQIARLDRGLDAAAFGRDDLPEAWLERWVNGAGQELVEVVPAEDLNDPDAAARFVAEVRTVAPNATGLPVVYQEAAATVTRAFSIALLYAFLAVSLLLLVFLRSLRDSLLVLLPIVFAAVVTAGISVLFGLPLNFANIIALPLLIGVGVDSGIHMVHRMRTEPPVDGDPLQTSTSRAVFASALTTVASFGNLAFSTHPGMASMGQLLTLGMVMSLIAILVLLPALLRLGGRS